MSIAKAAQQYLKRLEHRLQRARHNYAILEVEYNNAFLAPRELPGVEPRDAATAYAQGYVERPDRQE
ncbi:MAG: hypothetical protein LC747_01090, partial [Acidobacteria bacterium]|nr:hypothetical protein [Acidobacteriota bacterium]